MMNNLASLKEKLDLHSTWPLNYMFKFIVPAHMDKVAKVEALFDDSATIYRKESRTGKFVSISAKQKMADSWQIIEIYRKAQAIENIIAL